MNTRLIYLFAYFLLAKRGKPRLRAWRAMRRVCLARIK